MSKHSFIAGTVLIVVAGLAASSGGQTSSPIDLDWLRAEAGDGALVHHAGGRLYLTELADGVSVFLSEGNQPEFSPDGSRIAWIQGRSARGRLRRGDPTVHTIATDVEPSGGVHWLSATEVAVILERDGVRRWHRVSLDGRQSPIPELTRLGLGGYECDVRQGSDGVWSWVANRSWRTSDGRRGTLPGTCSVSLSIDGRTATSLHNPHKVAPLTAIRPGGIESELRWRYAGGFDNHRFASNDPRFIVAVDEHHRTMVVMTVDGSRMTRMGTLGRTKHGMYGDFTAGSGRASKWAPASATVAPGVSESGRGASRLHIQARLIRKRPIPPPGSYPDTLVVYDYEVERVKSGEYSEPKLLVVHRGARRGRVETRVRDLVEGTTYELELEPFDQHPRLHGLKLVENLEDLDLPLFVDVAGLR